MNLMWEDRVKVQALVNTNLFRSHKRLPISLSVSELLKTIVDKGPSLTATYFGDKVHEFVNSIDSEHPETSSILDHSSCELLKGFIQVGEFVSNNNFSLFSSQLRNIAISEFKNIFKEIKNPRTRILKTDARNLARQDKKVIEIDLSAFYRSSSSSQGLNYSPTLSSYVRYSNKYQEEINDLSKRKDKLFSLGLESMTEEANKLLQTLLSRVDDNFLGFQRINMTEVSVILAKLHGFKMQSLGENLSGHLGDRFVVPQDFLDPVPPKILYRSETLYGVCDYAARAYPYHQFAEIASSSTRNMIDYLDACPETNGKPIFDHYIVVVPSFSFINRKESKNIKPTIKSVLDSEYKDFSIQYIKLKKFLPVILGERDGKCFFLSYWE